MSLAFKSWVMDEQEREENKMIEIQTFIDELKDISVKAQDKEGFVGALNQIEILIKKYQKIIDEHINWIKKLKQEGINIKSGFLVDELKRPGDGGLLILEMNNYKNALKIIKNDPMIINDLVEWKLNEWIDSSK